MKRWIMGAGAAMALAAPGLAHAESACADLKSAKLVHAEVTSATSEKSGTVELCKLSVTSRPTADSDIRIEVWIPVGAAWNGKFVQLGNGGFAGSIASGRLKMMAASGYAVAGTDNGHQAMGTSARNIVLLGDQMQLGQPIQGVHPGRSGESALEYSLDGVATIAPDRGIFLAHTWRMHPHICRFISDAVYDGRLESERGTLNQSLLLDATAHPALKPTGIVFLPAQHEGCSQRSEVEASLVRDLYSSLLRQRYRDRNGREHLMTAENILVVAPYNMQVNLLKETLPEGARVGTVDKFQGQEAEVVIVSMATSSGDDLPRDIGFLYSKNRLNVAISRARCLAVLIANPALTSIRCKTPEDMALVNTLCWVRGYEVKA